MQEQGTYIPPRDNDIDNVYHWEVRGDFLLVARFLKRWQRLEGDQGMKSPQDIDLGYWRGYIGNKKIPDLHEYLHLHRGGRYWLNSSVIPAVDLDIRMVGFSGQEHNDYNICPDGSRGFFLRTDLTPIIELDCERIFAMLHRAIDGYLANPTRMPRRPEPAKFLACIEDWVEKIGLQNLQRMPSLSVKLATG